jgi:hypothetical protein
VSAYEAGGPDVSSTSRPPALRIGHTVPSRQDSIGRALAAIGFAIDLRDVVRRLDELRDGSP